MSDFQAFLLYLYLNGFWQVARPKFNGMVEL